MESVAASSVSRITRGYTADNEDDDDDGGDNVADYVAAAAGIETAVSCRLLSIVVVVFKKLMRFMAKEEAIYGARPMTSI